MINPESHISVLSSITAIDEDMTPDSITDETIKDSPKKQVFQPIARALWHEYGISLADMARGFSMKVGIAIFALNREQTVENVRRVVIYHKEPKSNGKGAATIRRHEQATEGLVLLMAVMRGHSGCKYALWTDRLEFFFLKKEEPRFDVDYRPLRDWPLADELICTRDVNSTARLWRAVPEMLHTAFCCYHNYIHSNDGMSKDAVFCQFLYLIFNSKQQLNWNLHNV